METIHNQEVDPTVNALSTAEKGLLARLLESGPRQAVFAVALGATTLAATNAEAYSSNFFESESFSNEQVDTKHPELYCHRIDDLLKQQEAKGGAANVDGALIYFGHDSRGKQVGFVEQVQTDTNGVITRWTVTTTDNHNHTLRVNCK